MISSLMHIPKGQQVFDTYGRKCNSRYLVNYGFVLDSNEENDEAQLEVSIRPDDPKDQLAALKCEILGYRRGGEGASRDDPFLLWNSWIVEFFYFSRGLVGRAIRWGQTSVPDPLGHEPCEGEISLQLPPNDQGHVCRGQGFFFPSSWRFNVVTWL